MIVHRLNNFYFSSRKASFVGDFNEEKDLSENIRYFFPTGCKGTDILIDNSSRLRSMLMTHILEGMHEANPRLPVTRRTTKSPSGYVYGDPSPNAYIPPGPPHIYAPNQIQAHTKKPDNLYLPASQADVSSSVNLPSKPASPIESNVNLFLPPVDTFSPPHKPADEYLPPAATPAPTVNHEIVSPSSTNCIGSSRCCDDSYGKIVIPIPLTTKDEGGCCKPQAQLILPMNGFDSKSLKELELSIPEEIDVTRLLKNILENLLWCAFIAGDNLWIKDLASDNLLNEMRYASFIILWVAIKAFSEKC